MVGRRIWNAGGGLWSRVAAVVVTAAALAPAAHAQLGRGMGMMRRAMEPAITTSQLERYEKFFGMDADQASSAKDLLQGYQGEFQTVSGEFRKKMEAARDEMRQNGDPSMWRELMPVMEEYQAKLTKLESTFIEDFKLTLNEDQVAKWDAFERLRRRDTTLDQGGLVSGETVDLFAVVQDAKVPADAMPAVQPLLDQYEIELDRALVERNAIYEQVMRRGMEMWQNQDMNGIQEGFQKARDAAVKLRDVNRRFARQIEGALPEGEARTTFANLFKEKSFPRVYGDSYVVNTLKSAEGLEDVQSAQKEQLAEIRTSYERESAVVNDKLAKAIEENELNRSAMSMMGMGGGSEEVRTLREERRTLDNGYYDKILAVLTEEQRKQMPERPANDWRRDAGGRGVDEDGGGRRGGFGGGPGRRGGGEGGGPRMRDGV